MSGEGALTAETSARSLLWIARLRERWCRIQVRAVEDVSKPLRRTSQLASQKHGLEMELEMWEEGEGKTHASMKVVTCSETSWSVMRWCSGTSAARLARTASTRPGSAQQQPEDQEERKGLTELGDEVLGGQVGLLELGPAHRLEDGRLLLGHDLLQIRGQLHQLASRKEKERKREGDARSRCGPSS